MGHLDIYNTHYGKKKGQESNWRFDSRPLKIKNQPNPGVCKWSAIHRWKALKENYKFSSDFIPIEGLNKKLWPRKVLKIQTMIVSGLFLGSPETKSHSDVGAAEKGEASAHPSTLSSVESWERALSSSHFRR